MKEQKLIFDNDFNTEARMALTGQYRNVSRK